MLALGVQRFAGCAAFSFRQMLDTVVSGYRHRQVHRFSVPDEAADAVVVAWERPPLIISLGRDGQLVVISERDVDVVRCSLRSGMGQ